MKFFFPGHKVTIEAKSAQEAEEKLNDFLLEKTSKNESTSTSKKKSKRDSGES